jgi:hypothetical protein
MKPLWKTVIMAGGLIISQIVFLVISLPASAGSLLDRFYHDSGVFIQNSEYPDIVMTNGDFIDTRGTESEGYILRSVMINGTLKSSYVSTVDSITPIITTNLLTVGGSLDISAPLKVTGDVKMLDGSSVMLAAQPRPAPRPGGDEFDTWVSERITEGTLDSNWEKDVHTMYISAGGQLTATRQITGGEMRALGMTPIPRPKPGGLPGEEALLSAASIILDQGSRLDFSFAEGYVPHVGDMFSLADCSLTITPGAQVMTNLGAGWAIFNSFATAEYIGTSVPEPSSLLLVGTGLAGLACGWLKRRKKA